MRTRWTIYYDGACPVCFKSKNTIFKLINSRIKLTAIDLNSDIAKLKGYNLKTVVLETPCEIYKGYHAWLKIFSETKYYKLTNGTFNRILFAIVYYLVTLYTKITKLYIKYIITKNNQI
jgi:predicted DCC family thiol-disulfide oxidoreductase YuxK